MYIAAIALRRKEVILNVLHEFPCWLRNESNFPATSGVPPFESQLAEAQLNCIPGPITTQRMVIGWRADGIGVGTGVHQAPYWVSYWLTGCVKSNMQ